MKLSGFAKKLIWDVLHFILGRAYSANNIMVYMLFPYLSVAAWRNRFISLTKKQLLR